MYLIRSLREPVIAVAVVTAGHVRAGAVTADARLRGALVGVHAAQPSLVQRVPVVAFAAERAVRVDAAPAAAHIRAHLALV